jgi:sarcosine oxidase subunit beta
VDTHLTVIDAPNGTYVRPDGDHATLVGRRTWVDEPLETPDTELPVVDDAFVTDAVERLARRIPSAAGAALASTRAGMLDMTPDGLPLLGPSGVDGLWLSCGWSGTGFKTAPAQGELLARWIADGEMPDPLLAHFAPRRELVDAGGAAVRSPH